MASNINHQDVVNEVAPNYDKLPRAKVQEEDCHRQGCKKKIEKLQQLNEELKKSAEAMQKIVKGQYMIQEALDKKVQKLERELYQARMKNWAATLDKTVLSTTWHQLFYYRKYIRILIYLMRFYLCQIIYIS